MRKRRLSVLALVPALVLFFAVQAAFCLDPQDKKALDLMDFAVKQTVKETGVQVIGVGSWTSEKKYKGPLAGGPRTTT